MSDDFREQLSALMDGELPRDQVRFLLRRIDNDVQLQQVWARYQLAGGVLRRQAAALPLRADFADRVMSGLAEESSGYGRHLLRWVGGGAIAAAVAVFALVSTRPVTTGPEPTTLASTPAPALLVTPAAARVAAPLPMQPVFDFAQPAAAVIPLPRYRHESALPEAQEMLGPYVLVTAPQPEQQAAPQY
jgi:sigma-E factor negative regulatory protein RseA